MDRPKEKPSWKAVPTASYNLSDPLLTSVPEAASNLLQRMTIVGNNEDKDKNSFVDEGTAGHESMNFTEEDEKVKMIEFELEVPICPPEKLEKVVDCFRGREDEVGREFVSRFDNNLKSTSNSTPLPGIYDLTEYMAQNPVVNFLRRPLLTDRRRVESQMVQKKSSVVEKREDDLSTESKFTSKKEKNESGFWSMEKVEDVLPGEFKSTGMKEEQHDSGFAEQLTRTPLDTYPPGKGCALIINNTDSHFKDGESGKGEREKREGSNLDVARLFHLLEILNYASSAVTYVENVDSRGLEAAIVEFKLECTRNDSGSCMVIILGHGGSDPRTLHMNDPNIIHIENDLISKFDDRHFPTFVGKPKIFFIEACRSSPTHQSSSNSGMGFQDYFMRSPSNMAADILVGFSTVPSLHSNRRNLDGSPYIRAITDVFTKYHGRCDIQTMLEMCIEKVAEYVNSVQGSTKEKLDIQIPYTQSIGFKKRFFFYSN